jgi:hypothetical protein
MIQAYDDNAYTEMDKFMWTLYNGMPSKQGNGTLFKKLINNLKCFLAGTQKRLSVQIL